MKKTILSIFLLLIAAFVYASGGSYTAGMPEVFGIRVEFILFGAILVSIALFHNKTFEISVTGFLVILGYKLLFDSGFNAIEHLLGKVSFLTQLADHNKREGEWGIILNLLGLLLGFAILEGILRNRGFRSLCRIRCLKVFGDLF